MLYTFIVSLLLFGIGAGLTTVGISNLNYVSNIDDKYYKENEIIIQMQDDLIINDFMIDDSEFIEEDREDLRLVYKHSDLYDLKVIQNDNHIILQKYSIDNKFKIIRKQISDINNMKTIDYSNVQVKIYTSKNKK